MCAHCKSQNIKFKKRRKNPILFDRSALSKCILGKILSHLRNYCFTNNISWLKYSPAFSVGIGGKKNGYLPLNLSKAEGNRRESREFFEWDRRKGRKNIKGGKKSHPLNINFLRYFFFKIFGWWTFVLTKRYLPIYFTDMLSFLVLLSNSRPSDIYLSKFVQHIT